MKSAKPNEPESPDPAFEPPEHLSDSSKELWRSLVPRRAKSAERLAMLTTALEARDRAEAARKLVEKEGMITTTKRTGMQHVHAGVKVEREARQQFVRTMELLKFQWCPGVDGRSQWGD